MLSEHGFSPDGGGKFRLTWLSRMSRDDKVNFTIDKEFRGSRTVFRKVNGRRVVLKHSRGEYLHLPAIIPESDNFCLLGCPAAPVVGRAWWAGVSDLLFSH